MNLLVDSSVDAAAAELDDLLRSIEEIAEYTDPKEKSEHSHRLLGTLFRMVGKLNYLLRSDFGAEGSKSPADQKGVSPGSTLLDSLDQWILKIKEAFSQLAKFLEAQSYTIGFGVPLGINVSITFKP